MSELLKACDEIGDAVTRAVALLARYKRGDVVPWKVLEDVSGFKRGPEGHWPQFRKRLQRDFMNATGGIVLWSVYGVGLELLTIHKQLHDRSFARHRRATRQLTKDIRELAAIPAEDLTDHEKAVRARKLVAARDERRKVLAGLRAGYALARPSSSGIPRVRIVPPEAAAG